MSTLHRAGGQDVKSQSPKSKFTLLDSLLERYTKSLFFSGMTSWDSRKKFLLSNRVNVQWQIPKQIITLFELASHSSRAQPIKLMWLILFCLKYNDLLAQRSSTNTVGAGAPPTAANGRQLVLSLLKILSYAEGSKGCSLFIYEYGRCEKRLSGGLKMGVSGNCKLFLPVISIGFMNMAFMAQVLLSKQWD